MLPIHMVDTKGQYAKIRHDVDAAIMDVINSSIFIGGKVVDEFRENLANYNGSKHVVPCANGTDALQIAMMAMDLKPGDEVITPSFTYIATAEVMALLRLKPVFVEVDPGTFCVSTEAIEAAISSRTRAIVPVHLFGQAADMEAIMTLAAKHNLFVIEDNAQAIGCDYTFSDGTIRKTGSIGTIGCTSFYPSKNLGCFGDGGAIFTNDDALAIKLKMIANHGQLTRYYHDVVGCNSRLDAIQAAVLNIKLKHLEKYNYARRAAADYYDKAFSGIPGISLPFRAPYCSHVFHQYTLLLEDGKRDGLQNFLSGHGIPSMIYYPVPAHKQKMFDALELDHFELSITDDLSRKVISLPMHTELTEEHLSYIVNNVSEFLKNKPL